MKYYRLKIKSGLLLHVKDLSVGVGGVIYGVDICNMRDSETWINPKNVGSKPQIDISGQSEILKSLRIRKYDLLDELNSLNNEIRKVVGEDIDIFVEKLYDLYKGPCCTKGAIESIVLDIYVAGLLDKRNIRSIEVNKKV